jgi:hypothetical protein
MTQFLATTTSVLARHPRGAVLSVLRQRGDRLKTKAILAGRAVQLSKLAMRGAFRLINLAGPPQPLEKAGDVRAEFRASLRLVGTPSRPHEQRILRQVRRQRKAR